MSKIVSFPKKLKKRSEKTFKQEDMDTSICVDRSYFLVDQLLEAQQFLNISTKEDKDYWMGARDWLKNLVIKEMIRGKT